MLTNVNVENIKGVANLDTLATDRKQKGGWAKRLYLYRGERNGHTFAGGSKAGRP